MKPGDYRLSQVDTGGVAGIMKQKDFVSAVCLAVFFFSGCSQELDKGKFEDVRGTAHACAVSVASGAGYEQLKRTVEQLSGEMSVLKGKISSDRERQLFKKYTELLAIYQDGLLLWKYKLEGSHYNFIPGGVIYVGQDVEPVVEKYRLPTESHVYGPTQQIWKSIPEDSLQIIWDNANSQMGIIETFTNN